MGSGTTGVAAVNTGRRFVGCEMREDYYQIAARRIAEAQQQIRMEILATI
jgi:DNA modification methylase